ncbi:uncharacterized protein BJ171DRAFT_583389 [Polychytrium aggregatum]|uniref:uncharacterized protein n=1 Tax=Polychytrium aggregatum TaxID=110093 RepID=UPI0022FE469A|nr:uncharacterized protein BJ171DRAFT_583389 [Polychytrium aggregatum]KAI9203222.1 hypothetical protein BJ171DRAFT_583389 [Polychytrium aggregatum]
MTSSNEPGSTAASSPTQQTQVQPLAALSDIVGAGSSLAILDPVQTSLEHNPDIFTIICCNDGFRLALDHSVIKTLLRVCRRARPLLSSKVPRFQTWCQKAGLCHFEGQMRIGLTPSDQIALSLHCKDPGSADRSWLVALAEQRNPSASYLLARILRTDIDNQKFAMWIEKEAIHKQIFRHLEKAANANHPMAQFHLAEYYRQGLGVDKDRSRAVEIYRSLAKCGMSQAHVALGDCYEVGEGVDQDYHTALEWYIEAVDHGSEDGRLHIMFLRGWFSFIGHGAEQSDADAFNHWQEVRSKSVDPVLKSIATHMVGWMHYLGRGTIRDKYKGIDIIRSNESEDFPLGEAGSLAAYPSHVTSSSPTARKFFQLCQFGSDRDWLCKHLMAVCQFQRLGTTMDRKSAAAIFEQLANDGHSDSQYWIGMCYLAGDGVSGDSKKALEWFSKSANQGNSYGQWKLGVCYYYGSGVAKNFTKAVEWFRKSAEQGNRCGQNSLGWCYEEGNGVLQDIDTAIEWYRKSADQENEDAIEVLNNFFEQHMFD